MLEKLLYEIRNGSALEVSSLATRLGTTPAMVQTMLEHLQHLGYIQPYDDACGGGCNGCSLSQACKADGQANKIRLWKYN